MTPPLAVIVDHLRELGLDDVARWVEHPDAVRELLRHTPVHDYADECPRCPQRSGSAHDARCQVAAAWRALGDARGAADIERAWEEALQTMAGRDELSGALVLAQTPAGRFLQVEALMRDDVIDRDDARRILGIGVRGCP